MTTPPSLFSVRSIITDAEGRVLLLQRAASSKHYADQWEFPGGKVDVGEALTQALRREVLEETGLVIEPGEWLDSGLSEVRGRTITTEFFEAQQTGGTLQLSEEHSDFAWVLPADLATRDLVPVMRKIARLYAAQPVGSTAARELRFDARIRAYHELRPEYTAVVERLVRRLRTAIMEVLPLAHVEGRAKTVVSFAEKLRRKAKYTDPLRQITDLCGVRILVGSEAEVAEAGRLVRALYTVDEANSLDALSRLRSDEFGYRSVHYVIRLTHEQVPEWPERFDGMAAEIQVRTWLQHAQANVDHDRVYKSPCPLPPALLREKARLAAQLESVDAGLQRLAQDIDIRQEQLGSALDLQSGATERELLKALRRHAPDNLSVVLRQVRLELADGSWGVAAALARAYMAAHNDAAPQSADLLSLGGFALCRAASAGGKEADHAEGVRWLLQATDRAPRSVKFWLRLGEILEQGNAVGAAEYFQRAYELDPRDNAALTGFIRTQGRALGIVRMARLITPTGLEALARYTRQAESGIVLAADHFRAAWLTLLLDRSEASGQPLELFLRGILAVRFEYEIDDAHGILALSDGDYCRQETELMQRVLRVVRHQRFPSVESSAWLQAIATPGATRITGSVALVAGSCEPLDESVLKEWRQLLTTAFGAFHGTLVSGGTTAGVAGLVGELSAAAGGRIHTIGYLPAKAVVGGASEFDARYTELRRTAGLGFSALEPVQGWIDLLASGIRSDEVTLIGLGGGPIAAFEYRLALILGAKVIVVVGTGRAADALASDPVWSTSQLNLTPLPMALADALALEALLPLTVGIRNKDLLNKLGELVHKDYLLQNPYSEIDPVRKKWAELREDLKESNRDQIASAARILATEGYAIVTQAATQDVEPVVFTDEEVNRMAEREHARWNLERLHSGWRYGPKKSVPEKLTPCLVPWAQLTEELKGYDRNAVNNYVKILGEAKLAIVRQATKSGIG